MVLSSVNRDAKLKESSEEGQGPSYHKGGGPPQEEGAILLRGPAHDMSRFPALNLSLPSNYNIAVSGHQLVTRCTASQCK